MRHDPSSTLHMHNFCLNFVILQIFDQEFDKISNILAAGDSLQTGTGPFCHFHRHLKVGSKHLKLKTPLKTSKIR